MKPRLGCLSFSGILAALVTLAVIIGVGLMRGGLLFSPGALNAQAGLQALGGVHSHAELQECSTCHTAPWEAVKMADRCTACHTDLANDPQDFHNVMLAAGEDMGCRRCHTEHQGADAALTVFDLARFPHNKIGFALTSHQQMRDGSTFSCADCHGADLSHFDQAVCADCHAELDAVPFEAHRTDFGEGCLECHDGLESYGEAFDHNQWPFPLEGKHTELACASCHTDARSITDLQNAPGACFDCHASDDAHEGRLGQSCVVCHNPANWQDASLDHSLTQFPLVGKHISVECKFCHVEQADGMLLHGTPTDCVACHAEEDVHENNLGTDCAQCHSPEDWEQANFDHSTADFRLDGKHITVACESCHTDLFFVDTPQDCFSCHSADDPHEAKLGSDCAGCHATSGWGDVTFDHSTAPFPLTGKHITVACESCHTDLLFVDTPQDCFSCHSPDDPHEGNLGSNCASCHATSGWGDVTFDHSTVSFQLTGKHATLSCDSCHTSLLFVDTPTLCYDCHIQDDHHDGQYGTTCDTCHTTSDWATITFDHSTASFQLTGAHATTACTNCHSGGVFDGTPQDCYACHSEDDNHDGQYGQSCGSCHSTSSWEGATFDHSLASFPLTGQHSDLACTSCHLNGVYDGTPTACVSCHGEPDYHQGVLGTDCAACHTTGGWSPASFNGAHTFPMNHGEDNNTCRSCHPDSLGAYTCYACHDANEMISHHNEEGITDLSNCLSCHPTGNKEDGGGGGDDDDD